MPASPPWVVSNSDAFRALLASDGLIALGDACRQLAATFLPASPPRESLFWIARPEAAAAGWLLEPRTLDTGRFHFPRTLRAELAALLQGDEPICALAGPPCLWLDPVGGTWPQLTGVEGEPDVTRSTLAVRIASGDGPPAALWLLDLDGPSAAPTADARDGLLQIAGIVGTVLPRLLDADQLQRQCRMMAHLHESMLKVMLDLDAHSLLGELLSVLGRDFGLRQICILLVHADTHALRGELHTGFGTHFSPPNLSLDDVSHPFVQALHQPAGNVLLYESSARGPVADWVVREDDAAPARAVLLPLQLPHRRVGLIYADQPHHDGTPFLKPVFELFARLAAVAIYHQQQHGRAETRAETDPLTGLRNRYFLDRILEIEVPRVKRYNTPISLLMIDLVDFKRINDLYGHQFGDFVLREAAGLLMSSVRRGDVVVRFGGDEFVVLMVNTRHDQATLVRERIEHAFVERNRLQRTESMAIHVSLGLRSAGAEDIDRLLHEADMAMYAHKGRQSRRQLLEALVSGDLERIDSADRMIASLCNILYKKEPYYLEHARRVAHLALRLAARVDLPPEDLETLALAALLHDVGKVSMPTETLQKREPLTDVEREAMRHHPALGEELLQGMPYLEAVRPLIRHHHERFDGEMTGEWRAYPDGVRGERLPLAARILRLAESVDGMLNERPYRPALPRDEVLRLLKEESGRSFDPRLTRLFLADEERLTRLGEVDAILEMLRENFI